MTDSRLAAVSTEVVTQPASDSRMAALSVEVIIQLNPPPPEGGVGGPVTSTRARGIIRSRLRPISQQIIRR